MKHRFFLIAWILCFTSCLFVSAEDGAEDPADPVVEQRIAIDLDGGDSAFYLFYTVKNAPVLVHDLFQNWNSLQIRSDRSESRPGSYMGEYGREMPPGTYFWYFDFSDPLGRYFGETFNWRRFRDEKRDFEIAWAIECKKQKVYLSPQKYRTGIFLAEEVDPANSIYDRDGEQDAVFQIVQLIDGDPLTFALLAANRSDGKVDLSGASTLRVRFPDGKTSADLFPASDREMILPPGGSRVVKVDLRKAIEAADGVSLSDFEYGLSEMTWSVRMPDGTERSCSRWFAKLNGEVAPYQKTDEFRKRLADGSAFRENAALPLDISLMDPTEHVLPEADENGQPPTFMQRLDAARGKKPSYYEAGYKLDGPLAPETFRERRIIPVTHGWNTFSYWYERATDPHMARAPETYLELTDRMMTFDLQRQTRTVCDLSRLEDGELVFEELPFGQAPGPKYLEIDVKRGPDGEVLPGADLGGIPCPAEFLLRLHSDDPEDGFQVIGKGIFPKELERTRNVPDPLVNEAPEQDYSVREIGMTLDGDVFRRDKRPRPFLFAAVRIGDRYGKLVVNDYPGVNVVSGAGGTLRRTVTGYRYNLDLFFNRTPGERDLTKMRDNYPATQEEIMAVSDRIRVGILSGLLNLCEGKKDLDFSVQDGKLLRNAMFSPDSSWAGMNRSAERLSIVEFLLEHGCAPLLATDTGVACAAAAVSANNIDLFLLLQKYGYDVNRVDKSGRNVTDYALDAFEQGAPSWSSTRNGTTRSLDPFFNGKLPEGRLALFRAVRRNDLEGVRKAIRENFGTEFINVPDKDGNTMLYYALRPEHPNPDIVRALLEAGATMERVTRQYSYDSALMTLTRPSENSGAYTKLQKQMEIVPILWEYRARLTEVEWLNMACVAAETGNAELFRFFMEKGLDPEKEGNIMSRTPATSAWQDGTKEMVDLLDSMGVRKPFWAAVKWNDMDLVKEYLRDGVDVNLDLGLRYAVMADLPDMAELLIQNGAHTAPEDYWKKNMEYPLRTVVERVHDGAAVVEVLMKHGFTAEHPKDPANPNWSSDSELVHALFLHKYKTAKLMVKCGARTDLKVPVQYFWGETLTGFPKVEEGSLAECFRKYPDALDAIGYEPGVFDYIGDSVHEAALFIMSPIRLYNSLLYGPPPLQ